MTLTFTKKENFVHSNQDLRNAAGDQSELLPCPFCGHEYPISGGRRNETTGNIVYTVQCGKGVTECSANVFTCLGGEDTREAARADAVNKWNTRQ